MGSERALQGSFLGKRSSLMRIGIGLFGKACRAPAAERDDDETRRQTAGLGTTEGLTCGVFLRVVDSLVPLGQKKSGEAGPLAFAPLRSPILRS
jgi:hypothetical protein